MFYPWCLDDSGNIHRSHGYLDFYADINPTFFCFRFNFDKVLLC